MSDTPELNLDALLARTRYRKPAGPRWSPEVTEARRLEQMRRHTEADRLARLALSRLHPDEYDILRKQAKTKIWAERGPLPGDEVSDG